MIVDDDREFLEELREAMVLSGYDIITVDDPLLALDAASEAKPDVILLDLKMPGKNGFQLADELSHSQGLMQIPIIAMTGNFKDEYAPLINMCNIRKCLKKPFDPAELISEIEYVLK